MSLRVISYNPSPSSGLETGAQSSQQSPSFKKITVLGPLLEATFIEVVEKVLGLEDGAMERTTSVIVM